MNREAMGLWYVDKVGIKVGAYKNFDKRQFKNDAELHKAYLDWEEEMYLSCANELGHEYAGIVFNKKIVKKKLNGWKKCGIIKGQLVSPKTEDTYKTIEHQINHSRNNHIILSENQMIKYAYSNYFNQLIHII